MGWVKSVQDEALPFNTLQMSKLTKYLESKTKDIEHHDSGSSYYKFGNKLIRVSDHLPPIQRPQDLHILVSGNSGTVYTAAVGGKIFTFVGLRGIKDFVDHWLIITAQNIKFTESDPDHKLASLRKTILQLNNRVTKAEGTRQITIGGINEKGKIIDISKFSVAQQRVLKGFIKQIK